MSNVFVCPLQCPQRSALTGLTPPPRKARLTPWHAPLWATRLPLCDGPLPRDKIWGYAFISSWLFARLFSYLFVHPSFLTLCFYSSSSYYEGQLLLLRTVSAFLHDCLLACLCVCLFTLPSLPCVSLLPSPSFSLLLLIPPLLAGLFTRLFTLPSLPCVSLPRLLILSLLLLVTLACSSFYPIVHPSFFT